MPFKTLLFRIIPMPYPFSCSIGQRQEFSLGLLTLVSVPIVHASGFRYLVSHQLFLLNKDAGFTDAKAN